MFNKIDFYDQNTKYVVTFAATFLVFFVLTPGNFFEINPSAEKKVETTRKISMGTTAVHALLFSVFVILFYYFYLNKSKKVYGMI